MFRILVRSLVLAALAAALYGDEIIVPIDGGSLVVGADFHPTTELAYKILYPDSQVYDLAFTVKNRTPLRWRTVQLRFDIGGLCEGRPKQWSIPIRVDGLAPYSEEWHLVEKGTQSVSSSPKHIELGGKAVIPIAEDPSGCSVEIVKAALLWAEHDWVSIPGTDTEPEDLSPELRAIQAARDLEAEVQAKKDAADAARQKRLAAQRKAKQAEDVARSAKAKREQEAKEAEERRRIREACGVLYKDTANKKVGDLTVREEQQVRACQGLGLFRPQ